MLIAVLELSNANGTRARKTLDWTKKNLQVLIAQPFAFTNWSIINTELNFGSFATKCAALATNSTDCANWINTNNTVSLCPSK